MIENLPIIYPSGITAEQENPPELLILPKTLIEVGLGRPQPLFFNGQAVRPGRICGCTVWMFRDNCYVCEWNRGLLSKEAFCAVYHVTDASFEELDKYSLTAFQGILRSARAKPICTAKDVWMYGVVHVPVSWIQGTL